MAFVRNIDPIESMKIGRREDAIEIVGIIFTIEGSKINPQSPQFIYNFLKRFEKIEFPDPLYHPHNIRLLAARMVEDRTAQFMAAMTKFGAMHGPSQILPSTPPSPVMKREISEIRLREFADKTIIFSGNFFLMPSIKILEEKAPWIVKDEEEEDQRIINEQLKHQKMEKAMKAMLKAEVDSEKRKQEMRHEYEMQRQQILKNATFKIKPDWASLI